MTHIDEKTLDLYILDAEEVKPQRAGIEAHLKECSDCAELFAELTRYYAEVQQIKEERAGATSQALTLRSMIVRVPWFDDRQPLSEIPKTMPARFVLFVIRHPVVSTLSVVSFLLAIFLFTYPREAEKDLNPAYARAKEEFLVAYNKNGEELWRKHVGVGFHSKETEVEKALATVDVDGDGTNEIIAALGYRVPEERPMRNTIICYKSDGSERWKYEFHRQMTFGKDAFSDDYICNFLAVGDYDRDGTTEVIAQAYHVPWYPSAIVKLDAQDGSFIAEYWHPGASSVGGGLSFVHKDLDGDGIEELIFGAVNNRFKRASLVVLDPRFVSGHSPIPAEYIPKGVPPASEKFYILFPASELEKFWYAHVANEAHALSLTQNNLIEVFVAEVFSGGVGDIIYYFDTSLRCVKAKPGDTYTTVYNRFLNEGKVSRKLDDQFFEELRKGIRYWDGEQFVREPTMNKRYLEAMKMLP